MTDSECQRLFELNAVRRRMLVAGQLPPGCADVEQARALIAADAKAVVDNWADIRDRKSRGVLTDHTKLTAVRKVIESAAAFHQVPIAFEPEEVEDDRDPVTHIARHWHLVAYFAGDTAELKTLYWKWLRMIEAINQELKPEFRSVIDWTRSMADTFVAPADRLPGYEQHPHPTDGMTEEQEDAWYDEKYERLEADEARTGKPAWSSDDEPHERPCYRYAVDTFVWDGPSRS